MNGLKRIVWDVTTLSFIASPIWLPGSFVMLRLRGTYDFTLDSLIAAMLFLVCVPISTLAMYASFDKSIWGKK